MAGDRELDAELADLSARIEKLRIHYQGYFLGLEKVPPLFERDQLERAIRTSALQDARKAVYKFRFQSLCQRFRTLAVYWDRVMRELEEGRISRESLRRDAGYSPMTTTREASGARPEGGPSAERIDAEGPGPSGVGPEASVGPQDPVVSLYRDYLTARASLGLPTEGITEAGFRASLEKVRQAQRERLGVPEVRFSVAVKDGKVILLARPETSGGQEGETR